VMPGRRELESRAPRSSRRVRHQPRHPHALNLASRPLWSGTISFGLLSIPVKLYSAISEHKLQFHLVHECDGSPIGYQKICKLEDAPVPDDEVVKAFQLRKGEFVKMTDEDFELARAASTDRMIEITDFISRRPSGRPVGCGQVSSARRWRRPLCRDKPCRGEGTMCPRSKFIVAQRDVVPVDPQNRGYLNG
jgi:Ku70/Ku80-like protein